MRREGRRWHCSQSARATGSGHKDTSQAARRCKQIPFPRPEAPEPPEPLDRLNHDRTRRNHNLSSLAPRPSPLHYPATHGRVPTAPTPHAAALPCCRAAVPRPRCLPLLTMKHTPPHHQVISTRCHALLSTMPPTPNCTPTAPQLHSHCRLSPKPWTASCCSTSPPCQGSTARDVSSTTNILHAARSRQQPHSHFPFTQVCTTTTTTAAISTLPQPSSSLCHRLALERHTLSS
jgi:hypothetical protein